MHQGNAHAFRAPERAPQFGYYGKHGGACVYCDCVCASTSLDRLPRAAAARLLSALLILSLSAKAMSRAWEATMASSEALVARWISSSTWPQGTRVSTARRSRQGGTPPRIASRRQEQEQKGVGTEA